METENQPPLELEPEMSDELGVESHALSRLSIGDRVVLYNLADKGIQDGSIGVVTEAEYINGQRSSFTIKVDGDLSKPVVLDNLEPKFWKRIDPDAEMGEEETLP